MVRQNFNFISESGDPQSGLGYYYWSKRQISVTGGPEALQVGRDGGNGQEAMVTYVKYCVSARASQGRQFERFDRMCDGRGSERQNIHAIVDRPWNRSETWKSGTSRILEQIRHTDRLASVSCWIEDHCLERRARFSSRPIGMWEMGSPSHRRNAQICEARKSSCEFIFFCKFCPRTNLLLEFKLSRRKRLQGLTEYKKLAVP
jgi:hypothetical protein